jgi:hypothetical protein
MPTPWSVRAWLKTSLVFVQAIEVNGYLGAFKFNSPRQAWEKS